MRSVQYHEPTELLVEWDMEGGNETAAVPSYRPRANKLQQAIERMHVACVASRSCILLIASVVADRWSKVWRLTPPPSFSNPKK